MQANNKDHTTKLLAITLVVLTVFFVLLFGVYPSHAAGWQEAERNCLRTCPTMPRFSGRETDAQYRERMRQQAAYDRCFMGCARQSSDRFTPTFVPIGEVEERYFKRNGTVVN